MGQDQFKKSLISLLDLKARLACPTFAGGVTINNANNEAKIVFGTSGSSTMHTDLNVGGVISATGVMYGGSDPCLTSYRAYTKTAS